MTYQIGQEFIGVSLEGVLQIWNGDIGQIVKIDSKDSSILMKFTRQNKLLHTISFEKNYIWLLPSTIAFSMKYFGVNDMLKVLKI